MQKSAAISSPVKTTATATPIKHVYSQEHLADISSSPRTSHSPIAQKLEEDKILETPPFSRDSPRRMSGNRNISTPSFFKRTMSLDGHKRHRTSSESARTSTPPRMELVSRSVRQSPTRRPFSANFEESFYQPRPLSASKTSGHGQSAPAYFFIGGSPYNSPPSLREHSPLQLTMGEISPPFSQPFETPPELSETTIMDVSQTRCFVLLLW